MNLHLPGVDRGVLVARPNPTKFASRSTTTTLNHPPLPMSPFWEVLAKSSPPTRKAGTLGRILVLQEKGTMDRQRSQDRTSSGDSVSQLARFVKRPDATQAGDAVGAKRRRWPFVRLAQCRHLIPSHPLRLLVLHRSPGDLMGHARIRRPGVCSSDSGSPPTRLLSHSLQMLQRHSRVKLSKLMHIIDRVTSSIGPFPGEDAGALPLPSSQPQMVDSRSGILRLVIHGR